MVGCRLSTEPAAGRCVTSRAKVRPGQGPAGTFCPAFSAACMAKATNETPAARLQAQCLFRGADVGDGNPVTVASGARDRRLPGARRRPARYRRRLR